MRSLWIASLKLRPPALFSATLFFACLFPILLHPYQTFAANGDPIAHEDHNYPLILDNVQLLDSKTDRERYESNFLGLDRSIIGRAEDNQALANNVPGQLNIEQGKDQFWTFPKQALLGPQSPHTPGLPPPYQKQYPPPKAGSSDETILYISLTACLQPNPKDPNVKGAPDQLKLYLSTNSGNKQPSLAQHDYAVSVEEGFLSLNISVKGDVYFGISAPDNDDFAGVYNYQLTASIDGYYASYDDELKLSFIDSDSSSALLYTKNLTTDNSTKPDFQKWMTGPPRFHIFVHNQDNPSILGMQRSVCALQDFADVRAPAAIDTGMTIAGDNSPKQQFHVRTLNASSSYYAVAAVVGNSTDSGNGIVGGGGIVGSSTIFRTKSNSNCGLLHNLTFCTSVAYSAPANFGNPNVLNLTALGQHYDDYAKSQYLNFSRSLQQIPCDTTSSAQYSLTRTCTDCDEAYKKWLCAVTIPRCEDFSNTAFHLRPRALNQSFTNQTLADQTASDPAYNISNDKLKLQFATSRNPMIDIDIKPGPYKEVLPCAELCYGLVQSCPASLQFVCPLKNHGLEETYGTKGSSPENVTCSFPGAGINRTSGAVLMEQPAAWIAFGVALVLMTT